MRQSSQARRSEANARRGIRSGECSIGRVLASAGGMANKQECVPVTANVDVLVVLKDITVDALDVGEACPQKAAGR